MPRRTSGNFVISHVQSSHGALANSLGTAGCWAGRLAPITVLTQSAKNTVHGADRTQVLILLQQPLVHFPWRLITPGFAVQRLDYHRTLLGTERAWLYRLFTATPRWLIVGSAFTVCIHGTSIEPQRTARLRQWQSCRAMGNHVIHTSFPLRKRSSIDKVFCKSRQSLALSNLRFRRLFSFSSGSMRR